MMFKDYAKVIRAGRNIFIDRLGGLDLCKDSI